MARLHLDDIRRQLWEAEESGDRSKWAELMENTPRNLHYLINLITEQQDMIQKYSILLKEYMEKCGEIPPIPTEPEPDKVARNGIEKIRKRLQLNKPKVHHNNLKLGSLAKAKRLTVPWPKGRAAYHHVRDGDWCASCRLQWARDNGLIP